MSKTIIINEDIANELKNNLSMTNFKFKTHLKKFLAGLLEDPVGTDVEYIFKHHGIDKNKLIKLLVDNNIIKKKMTIDDHDAEGNPHTAKMVVKYTVPKERFNDRIDCLFDLLFPDIATPINEDGGGGATSCSGVGGGVPGADSGQYSQPIFPMMSKNTVAKNTKKRKNNKVGGDAFTQTLSETKHKNDIEKGSALYCFCYDDNNELYTLCAKRLSKIENNKYNPPMGHLMKGESSIDGAVRECFEESGIKIDKNLLKLEDKESFGDNFSVLLNGTINQWKSGKGDGENTKFKWIKVKDVSDLEFAFDCKKYLLKYAKQYNKSTLNEYLDKHFMNPLKKYVTNLQGNSEAEFEDILQGYCYKVYE